VVLSVVQTQEALARTEDHSAQLTAVREALVDKETTIDQLKEQVETLLHEVTSLNEAYARLQVISLLILDISVISSLYQLAFVKL